MIGLFDAKEIVNLGIVIEENGYEFYTTLSQNTKGAISKEIFNYLAQAEKNHIQVFEKIGKELEDVKVKETYPGEYENYLRTLADEHVFTKKHRGKEYAEKIKDEEEALNLALSFEKDSVLLFDEMKRFVSEKQHIYIDKLIAEEKKHIVQLREMKEEIKKELKK